MPNYTLHLLGQGMVSRKMTEWYHREGYEYPRLWAIGTMLTGAFLNETVENNSYRGGNTDPIADFYFFNPVGILMYSFDPVARFFSETVQVEFWPGQPALILNEMAIYNAAENYSVRIDPKLVKGVRFFMYGGTEGLFGLTFDHSSGDSFLRGQCRKVALKPVYETVRGCPSPTRRRISSTRPSGSSRVTPRELQGRHRLRAGAADEHLQGSSSWDRYRQDTSCGCRRPPDS